MLKLKTVSSFKDRCAVLSEFNPEQDIFVVSDIKSKITLKRLIFERSKKSFPFQKIFRASEFWAFCLNQIAPQKSLISQTELNILFFDFLQKNTEIKKQFSYLKLFKQDDFFDFFFKVSPFLKSNEEPLKEWFLQNKESFKSWGKLYELSKKFWNELDQKNLLPEPLASVFLVDELYFKKSFPFKKIIFDLSWTLTTSEKELIENLSHQFEVLLLIPTNAFEEKDSIYSELQKKGLVTLDDLDASKKVEAQKIKSFCLKTQVSELKFAASQIRKLTQSGVALNQIAVVAPDIELYWPSLKHHLNFEGIHFQKEIFERLNSFSTIQKWLASLRVAVGEVSFFDLENIFFFERAAKRFFQFKRQYFFAQTEEDIENLKLYENLFLKSKKINFQDFLKKAISIFPKTKNIEPLNKVLEGLNFFLRSNILKLPKEWFLFLSYIISKKEIEVQSESNEGVLVLGLDALNWQDVSYIIFLGCTESQINTFSRSQFLIKDEKKIAQDLGLYLNKKDPFFMQKELNFILNYGSYKSIFVLASETNFEGGGEVLHSQFLSLGSFETEFENLSRLQGLAHSKTYEKSNEAIGLDFAPPFKLSASSLRKYSRCPFIFCAEKVFGLPESKDLEVDISYILKGNLLHKVFEKVVLNQNYLDLNLSDLSFIVDEVLAKQISLEDKKYKSVLKTFLLKKLDQFLENERHCYSKGFSDFKVVGIEKEFQAFFDLKKQTFQKDPTDFSFKGFIDRIDERLDHYLVYDYKSEHPGVATFLKDHIFQPLIYLQVLEQGLIPDLKPKKVKASLLYNYKDFKKGGYADLNTYKSALHKSHLRTEEEKLEQVRKMNLKIEMILKSILENKFNAEPEDRATCKDCSWSLMCRAKHL